MYGSLKLRTWSRAGFIFGILNAKFSCWRSSLRACIPTTELLVVCTSSVRIVPRGGYLVLLHQLIGAHIERARTLKKFGCAKKRFSIYSRKIEGYLTHTICACAEGSTREWYSTRVFNTGGVYFGYWWKIIGRFNGHQVPLDAYHCWPLINLTLSARNYRVVSCYSIQKN